MTTEDALLAAVWDSPHDDLPRLVYADWLDETGEPAKAARAEFIRVQCELARLPGDDPRFDSLETRQTELEKLHGRAWKAAMPSGARYGHFDRGFLLPSLERHKFDGLFKVKPEKLRAAPLWRYHYGLRWGQAAQLLDWLPLARFGMFAARPPVARGWAARIAACPLLENVSDLQLIDCRPETGEVRTVLDAWAGRRLDTLRFNPGRLDAAGFALLASHPATTDLRRLVLDAERADRTTGTLADLLEGSSLGNLIHLSLSHLRVSKDDLDVLLRWPGLQRVRSLSLYSLGLTNDFAVGLAACPNTAGLRRLHLGWNRIGVTGARALVESPFLSRDLDLTLYGNPADSDGSLQKVLKRRFRNS